MYKSPLGNYSFCGSFKTSATAKLYSYKVGGQKVDLSDWCTPRDRRPEFRSVPTLIDPCYVTYSLRDCHFYPLKYHIFEVKSLLNYVHIMIKLTKIYIASCFY